MADEPQEAPDSPTDDDGDEERVTLKRSDIRAMEKRASEAAALARENAFLKAGIPVDSGPGKLLFKAYDGEPTAEAVLEAAEEYGIKPNTSEQPAESEAGGQPEQGRQRETAYEPTEQGSTEQRAALRTGATPSDGSQNPRRQALDEAQRIMDEGGRREDAMVHALRRLATAAVEGDNRVLVNPGDQRR